VGGGGGIGVGGVGGMGVGGVGSIGVGGVGMGRPQRMVKIMGMRK
jgi:hypothetical protein